MESVQNIKASLTVLYEMFIDRKQNVAEMKTYIDTIDDILCQTNGIFEIPVNNSTKIIFFVHGKFKINDLKKHLHSHERTNTLMVIKDKITNINKRNIEDVLGCNFEIFSIKELLFNISKHIYVPKHMIVDDESELTSILNTYNLKNKSNLPIILKSDPMAKYLNLQTGDIVKIFRKSNVIGKSITYRLCM